MNQIHIRGNSSIRDKGSWIINWTSIMTYVVSFINNYIVNSNKWLIHKVFMFSVNWSPKLKQIWGPQKGAMSFIKFQVEMRWIIIIVIIEWNDVSHEKVSIHGSLENYLPLFHEPSSKHLKGFSLGSPVFWAEDLIDWGISSKVWFLLALLLEHF